MITSILRITILSGLVLLSASHTFAQVSTSPTQLALEIRFYPNEPPAYQTVHPSVQRGGWFARFPRVAEWVAPKDSLPVTAVNIKSQQAEDGVRVWVSVFLGKLHEEEKQVASYVLHEGDSITAKELAGVGVVPFEIKVVRLSAAVSALADFKSKAPSIELVSIQSNFSTMPTIQLVLRNVSTKTVLALEVKTLQGGRPEMSTMPQGKEGAPLIVPGGTFEMTMLLASRSVPGPNGYQPETPPNQTIEVSAAMFADSSYEGDYDKALAFIGFQKGRKIQLARVIDLLDKSASETADVTSLKDQATALGLKADSTAIEDLHRQFPQEKQIDHVRTVIQLGMQGVREDLLKDIAQFELHSRYEDRSAFNSWLVSAKQKYHSWLSRM